MLDKLSQRWLRAVALSFLLAGMVLWEVTAAASLGRGPQPLGQHLAESMMLVLLKHSL